MVLLPLLASICDTVITHPNVANAACFQTLPPNVLYVEGYALDQFFRGAWTLAPVRQNRVGVIWDSGIPEDMAMLHRNTMAAVETVYGVSLVSMEPTASPVRLRLLTGESGRSTGVVANPEVLLATAQTLIEQGATALAVCCLMPEAGDEAEDSAYKSGAGVDPISGLEAMISHLLVSHFKLPVAHAPVFPYELALPVRDHAVDPRAASEFIVSTFLPCVLTGLAKAPQYGTTLERPAHALDVSQLSALVVPGDALGSIPVLAAVERGIAVFAVANNRTVMQCPPEALGLEAKVTQCANYMELLGRLVAMKAGITLPRHFEVPVGTAS